jgi:DNA-binding transcriptional LysR family regulator
VDLNRIPPVLLQTFLTVAEAGQISEAARRLHLSQPAVTGHIRRLEASLETTLFIRSANGVSLTERGAHLRERVQDVFAELEEIWRELDRTHEVNGTLTLSASTTVARYFVPRIFIRFHHYHPAAALHLLVGNTEEVLDHLRQIARRARTGRGHQRSPGVHLEQFMPDEIVPVCAPRIQRMFSWALPSGELGGLPGEFYQFANSIRQRFIHVERPPLKRGCLRTETGSWIRDGNCPPERFRPSIVLADMRSEHPITP